MRGFLAMAFLYIVLRLVISDAQLLWEVNRSVYYDNFENTDNSLENNEIEQLESSEMENPEDSSEAIDETKGRFLLRLNLEKLLTIPGANEIHKYKLEENKIVNLVSEVMGADLVELGEAKTTLVLEVVEVFRILQKKMIELSEEHSTEVLFDWFLEFIARGWPLYSEVNNLEIFDYVDILTNSFSDSEVGLDEDTITEELIKDVLEDMMGISIQEYVQWIKDQGIAQDEFMEQQIILLGKLARTEGVDFSLEVYKLVDEVHDKLRYSGERLDDLWQQIYEKHLDAGNNDADAKVVRGVTLNRLFAFL